MPLNVIKVETQAGDPIILGSKKIYPFSRSLNIRIPGWSGGFIWNRPNSLLVIDSDGQEHLLSVPDKTRIAQIALLAFGLFGCILIWLYFQPKGSQGG